MAIAAPVVDTSQFANLAQESQQRSGDLVNAAWARLSQLNLANQQAAVPPGAASPFGGIPGMSQVSGEEMSSAISAYNQGAQGTPVAGATPELRDLLAKTLQAEAGGEGYEGLLAAGSVIMNRVNSGNYGKGVDGVIMRPGQFSAWNKVTGYAGGEGGLDMDRITPSQQAYAATDALLGGSYKDPTGGATHYYNPSVANPAWGAKRGGADKQWQTIGNHIFGFADAGRARPQAPVQAQAPVPVAPQQPNTFVNSSPWLTFGQPVY